MTQAKQARSSALMQTYNRIPVDFVRGQGSYLFDSEGKQYLDAISGIAVCALGHNHPTFTQAVKDQVETLVHTSNLYGIPLQDQLAQKLCAASAMDSVFFCNSGTEANEAAIKLARMYGHKRNIQVPSIIVMEGAFHGRSMGSLTATHNNKHQAGFAPLLDGFIRVPYDDVAAVEQAISENANVVAIMLEPLQGEGGVILCQDDYLQSLRALCDHHELLLMLDEVQTGNGRTGEYFAYQHTSILPDVLTTAKGLGNGFPIGACLTQGNASHILQPGHHATTFGGSPLACAAGLAVNKAIIEEELVQNSKVQGMHLLSAFRQTLKDCKHITDIRGLGLMIGIEFDQPCSELLQTAREHGLLINVTSGNVLRLLPPLNISTAEADIIIEITTKIVREFAHDC